MKSKSLVLLAIAACCGLVAMLGVQQVLSGSNKEGPETVNVLVARSDVNAGVRLDDTLVAFKALPVEAVPPGAVLKKEDFNDRALKHRAFPGQVILKAQLGEKGQFGATINIPEGMRVVTVPVNDTMTHSGLMKPGDRVDVLVTYKVTKPKVGSVTRTKAILEFIEVYQTDSLRIGGETPTEGGTQAKNVSLMVTPEQANLLQLAISKGTLHLTLRNKLDDTPAMVSDIDDNKLESVQAVFDEAPEEPEPAPAEPEPAPQPTFTEFVDKTPVTPVVVEPPKPTWKVQIHHGKEVKVEELELPVETASTSALPAIDGATSTTLSGNWMNRLMQSVLQGEKSSPKNEEPAALPVIAN